VLELVPYLLDSFGNSTRIDYGTGHEMAFVMLLCCLFRCGGLAEGDRPAVGLAVMAAYMELVRELQERYRMEPAGSMGVWNLDDYQFVAFIWGAAQMGDRARLKPKAIPDPEMAEMLAKENQFFACLAYIHRVKTGPFHEHSNQLWNISAVPNWPKVFTGLVKMYRAEVLTKFPVIQHSLFGSLLHLGPAATRMEADPPAVRPGPPGIDSPRPAPHLSRLGGMPPGMGAMPPGMGAMPPGMGAMPPGMGMGAMEGPVLTVCPAAPGFTARPAGAGGHLPL
jgi:serine/threonine-protein phosphatase 2A activator